MRYERFYSKLFCSPLCLSTTARTAFERVLLSHMEGKPTDFFRAGEQPEFAARKVDAMRANNYADGLLEIEGKTAIVHIDGAIDRHLSSLDRICFDATDLNDVNRALGRIESDGNISNLLVAINSPGGVVNGVPETAARIAAIGRTKTTKAFIDGLGCSAGYWLASSCDEVFATESSTVGSIGVYLALLDESRWLEGRGLKIETVKDGKLKAAGASWKALTAEERAHFQGMVGQIGELFRSSVTAKRPNVEKATMEGQAFFGKAALEVGLIDALVPDLRAALAQF